MKLKFAALLISGFAAPAMMVLAAVPAQAATSARSSTAAHTSTAALSGTKTQARPGAHAFAQKVRISKTFARSLVRKYGPDYQGFYKSKVYCNGGSTGNWSGFNATIQWGGNGSIAVPAYLTVDGEVWDGCGATAYAYVSYTNGIGSYDPQVQHASSYNTAGVHYTTSSDYATYGNITIDVCTNYNGWRCGKPQGPGA